MNCCCRISGHTSDKDVPVLASAFTGKADFLVTGDKKDFTKLRIKSSYQFKIVSPSKFLEMIMPLLARYEIELIRIEKRLH